MGRAISYDLYIYSFLISLGIFAIGIYIGTLLDQKHLSDASYEIKSLNERMNVLFLMSNFEEKKILCPVYFSEYERVSEKMELLGKKIWFLEEEKGVSNLSIKRDYFLLEAEVFYLMQYINKNCNRSLPTVLYFYTNLEGKCSSCDKQGEHLYIFGKERGIRVLSFDGELGGSVVDVLKAKFNITKYPSVVINGKVYEGFISKEELDKVIEDV